MVGVRSRVIEAKLREIKSPITEDVTYEVLVRYRRFDGDKTHIRRRFSNQSDAEQFLRGAERAMMAKRHRARRRKGA